VIQDIKRSRDVSKNRFMQICPMNLKLSKITKCYV
jgi:hypothetical protein